MSEEHVDERAGQVAALIVHGLRWRMRGLSYPLDIDWESGELGDIWVIDEPEWRYDALTPSQLTHLWKTITADESLESMQRRYPDADERRRACFMGELGHYGIGCPHWPAHRVYSPRDGGKSSECCDCHAILVTDRSVRDYYDDERRRNGEFVPRRDHRCLLCGLPAAFDSVFGPNEPPDIFTPLDVPAAVPAGREAIYRCPRGHALREWIPWSQRVAERSA